MAADPPTYEQALELLRRGDPAGARRAAEAALSAGPGNGRLLHLLGSLSCHAGDLAQGISYLSRALEVDASDLGSRLNLARALYSDGQVDEAIGVCAGAPAGSETVELRRLLGQLLQERGRQAEAGAVYESVVAARPGDWEIWNNLGNARRLSGDPAGAVAALRRAATIRSDVAPIQVNLGSALADAGDMEAALAAYRRALALAPEDPAIRLDTARLLRDLRRFEEALDLLRSGASGPDELIETGRSLSGLWRLDEAERAYRTVLAMRRDLDEAWLELGIAVERAGRVDDIEPILAEAASEGVDENRLAYLRALLLQRRGRIDEALEWARRAPADLDPGRSQRLVAKLADKAGRPDLAFAAAAESNRIAAEERPGAIALAAGYREEIAAIAAIVTPEWYARWTPAPPPPPERRAPAFLVGFPRSGTTLLDTLLMGHPATHVLEEVPLLDRVMQQIGDFARIADLSAAEIEDLRRVYFAALDETHPPESATLVVDKLPLNMLGAPLIHRLFPDAPIILALRHPCDVAISCFIQDFELNKAMANFLDLDSTASLYDLVLGLWTRSRAMMPLRVFEVRYEGLVDDPAPVMRALVDFLGLEWSERVLDHQRTAAERGTISTPSYNQVTQPIYGGASGRWRRYEEQLEPVLPVLLPWAERLGYEMKS